MMYAYLRFQMAFVSMLLYFGCAYSQVVDADISATGKRYFITGYVQVFESDTYLPFDSVLSSKQVRFKKFKNKEVVFSGYDEYHYWFRFFVRNKDSLRKKLALVLGPIGIRDAELFQSQKGQWKSLGKTGIQYPFITRPYQHAHYTFPIEMPASSLDTFYLSMDFGNEFRSFAFVLMDNRAFKKFENSFYFFFGIVIGLLSLFFTLNLYFFFSFKEKIHLWYALYIAMLIFLVMINDELSAQFLHFDSERAYKVTSVSAVGGLTIAVFVHVLQLFLLNVSQKSSLFRATLIVKWNLIVSALTHLVAFNVEPGIPVQEIIFYWLNYSTILGIGVILFYCLYSFQKGSREALYILIGFGVFLTGSLEKLLLLSNSSYIFPPDLFHIGIILETTTISFALIYRHRYEREETMKLLREEEQRKVATERQILEIMLEIQEETFKKISEDIHDNMLQLLTLTKLKLNKMFSANPNDFNVKLLEFEEVFSTMPEVLDDLSKSIHPQSDIGVGVIESLRLKLEQVKRTAGFQTELSITGQILQIDHNKGIILSRICQESLNNIVKHANADVIKVQVQFTPENLKITITDNGDGFSLKEVEESDIEKYGLGIRNMKRRARLIAAELHISSGVGRGTEVMVMLPVGSL